MRFSLSSSAIRVTWRCRRTSSYNMLSTCSARTEIFLTNHTIVVSHKQIPNQGYTKIMTWFFSCRENKFPYSWGVRTGLKCPICPSCHHCSSDDSAPQFSFSHVELIFIKTHGFITWSFSCGNGSEGRHFSWKKLMFVQVTAGCVTRCFCEPRLGHIWSTCGLMLIFLTLSNRVRTIN